MLPEGTFGDGVGLTSMTDEGLGRFSFDFDTALPDAEYDVVVSADEGTYQIVRKSLTSFEIAFEENGAPIEPAFSFVVYAPSDAANL